MQRSSKPELLDAFIHKLKRRSEADIRLAQELARVAFEHTERRKSVKQR
jgi:hypothetical protein